MRRFSLLLVLLLILTSCREMVEKEADEKVAMAEAALHLEQWDVADESFHDAILLDPDRTDAWIGRGMTLTQKGEFKEARVHYEEALSICEKGLETDPLALKLISHQIMLLVLLDRSDEARELARVTIETHPDTDMVQFLPALIDELHTDFQEMILRAEEPNNANSAQ